LSGIYVFGSGGHGAVVAEIAQACAYMIIGFADDNPDSIGTPVLGFDVLGGREAVPDGALVALGVGHNPAREDLMRYGEAHGWRIVTLAHPSAVISPSAILGEGAVVMANVVVNARANIGRGCVLNTACSVDHDCLISDFAHIAPGARLAGTFSVGKRSMVGIGSCVRQKMTIGQDCLIGAGSVVVSDIPDGATAYGNPAKLRACNPRD
jgi:UDP-N-acetylbacillosamine N-acetyltransferase